MTPPTADHRPSATRLFLARRVFGNLSGLTFGRWLRLLVDNGFAVHPGYALRAAFITLSSLTNSALGRREERRHGAAVRQTTVTRPVFVLGHWRSGTTHLHNLLACDPRLAWPSMHEVLYPHTFLTSQDPVRWGGGILTPTRLIDAIPLGFGNPHEDEFGLCLICLRSPYVGWAFPRSHDRFARFLTFRGTRPEDAAAWKAALVHFAKKLSFRHQGRPIVFKSPTHTARIRLLLELFPDARFVHIHREPFRLFESTRAMVRTATGLMGLQPLPEAGLDERVLHDHEAMYQAFFEERGMVPAGRLHEMSYEALDRDPVGEVRRLYQALSLPDFSEAEPLVRAHLQALGTYRKNPHPGLNQQERGAVAERWHRYFEEWGYRP
jgi:hypothetical protein